MSKEYAIGSIIHLETTYIGSGYVESGKGCNAFQIPLPGAKIIAHFPPKLEIGMDVSVNGCFYEKKIFKIIGIDEESVWLKCKQTNTRTYLNAKDVHIIA